MKFVQNRESRVQSKIDSVKIESKSCEIARPSLISIEATGVISLMVVVD